MTSASDDFPAASKKRQRKSRFAFRSSTEAPQATNDVTPKNTSSAPHPSASVSTLRAHINEQKALLSSKNTSASPFDHAPNHGQAVASATPQNYSTFSSKSVLDAPPVKRQKMGRSRFAQATPSNASQTVALPKSYESQTGAFPSSQNQSFPWRASSSMKPMDFTDVTAIPIAPVKTVNINRKADKKLKLTAVLKVSKGDLLETDPLKNPYFDPSLPQPARPPQPIRKQVNFVPEGAIAIRAEKERERATVQVNRNNYISELTNSAINSSDLPVLPPLADDLTLHANHEVPKAEWWDLPFLVRPDSFLGIEDEEDGSDSVLETSRTGNLDNNLHENVDIELREERITHYIHHPPKINPAKPIKPPPAVPLMLTKKEIKKLRRQRRKEANQEKQEMIAAGLLPPPPPKVKLSNMMRVLSNETSIDPTKVETEVRAQVEARRQKHEADNEARKKSREEKHEKAREKRGKDREDGLLAAVYRVFDVSDATNRFKIIRNARQLELTGVLLKFNGCNVIVVEGGAKVLRKYKKLMLRRIDWQGLKKSTNFGKESAKFEESAEVDLNAEQDKNSEQLGDILQTHGCVLVWEGVITSASFEGFRFMEMRGESACRKMFRERHVEHYWDLCLQASPLGNDKLGVTKME